MKLRDVYSQTFLREELVPTAGRAEVSVFAELMRVCGSSALGGLNVRGSYVSIYKVDRDSGLIAESYHDGVAEIDPDWPGLYRRHHALDFWTQPQRLKLTGASLFSTDLIVAKDFVKSEYFTRVKEPLGMSNSAYVIHRVPFAEDLRLTLGFDAALRAPDWRETRDLDYFFLPFYFAALLLFQRVDRPTVLSWMDLLSGLSLSRLNLLREIVCSPRYHAGVSAKRLGISPRTVGNQIYQISLLVESKLPTPEDHEGYGSQIVDLVNAYQFRASPDGPSCRRSGRRC